MSLRVMWLLNHSSARKFEIPMLKSIGVQEIFLPKNYPDDPAFRSASVDWSEDQHLKLPPEHLAVLNATNWYAGGTPEAWTIANLYFDVCFFIIQAPEILQATRYFEGILLWRAYGLESPKTYTFVLDHLTKGLGAWNLIEKAGKRFHFTQAYAHLHELEADALKRRSLHLPLGLHNAAVNDAWQGGNRKIFFVCPDIGFNVYYETIYTDFIADFGDFPYAIGGAQPVRVDDPAILGYTPLAVHEENMRQMRVMFYHSTEPNHVHYHPFEAVRAGMPLVFMAGGMLDRMGGKDLPGRCETTGEARNKLRRVLDGDQRLIDNIRSSQPALLEQMKAEHCRPAWVLGFKRIAAVLESCRTERQARPGTFPQESGGARRKQRVAIILPIEYRGGTLRGAKLLAQAMYEGSRQAGEDAEIVFMHLDDPIVYPKEEFDDLHPGIARRTFNWKALPYDEARRAMHYAGHPSWIPSADRYLVPDDGIRQAQDCDLWLLVSDRFSAPLLPLRPCVHMVYDYVQRYLPVLPNGADRPFIDVVRRATRVLVTTRFTEQDALQYAGLKAKNVIRLPMLAPDFSAAEDDAIAEPQPVARYFVWSTNTALHKNHDKALKALTWYYDKLDGQLECRVTGENTADFANSALPHLASAIAQIKASKSLRKHLRWKGVLPERAYRRTLSRAAFLWHPATIDNGTFSVIEAASLGIPALSSDYPAMREIDAQFSLDLAWMNGRDPEAMALQLKQMELNHLQRRSLLPSKETLGEQSVTRLAQEYWKAVRACL